MFVATRQAGRVLHTYTRAIRGFAAQLTESELGALRVDPGVAYLEQDQVMRIVTTQTNATWGIDRIDQRSRPIDGTFTYSNTGSGVNAYIIDTGILLTHSEFTGRVFTGFDAVTAGGTANDCNGHGTHVAGTTGGTTYGVAKGVKLYAVRVLSCSGSGTTSGVIAGVDWVTANHVQPAVANMSLGGGASTTLDNAVANSIAAGVGITSAWYTSNTATHTISGTSMATPHVAGVAALYLQSNPGASAQTVRDALYANTTKGIVTSSSTANNHLLFTNY